MHIVALWSFILFQPHFWGHSASYSKVDGVPRMTTIQFLNLTVFDADNQVKDSQSTEMYQKAQVLDQLVGVPREKWRVQLG